MSPAVLPPSFKSQRAVGVAKRRIATSYDARGLVHKVTSYDAASGGAVVNEAERLFIVVLP